MSVDKKSLFASQNSPEIKIVHRTLLISHVDVEREEIDGSKRPATQDLEQGRETIALLRVGERIGGSHLVTFEGCEW